MAFQALLAHFRVSSGKALKVKHFKSLRPHTCRRAYIFGLSQRIWTKIRSWTSTTQTRRERIILFSADKTYGAIAKFSDLERSFSRPSRVLDGIGFTLEWDRGSGDIFFQDSSRVSDGIGLLNGIMYLEVGPWEWRNFIQDSSRISDGIDPLNGIDFTPGWDRVSEEIFFKIFKTRAAC